LGLFLGLKLGFGVPRLCDVREAAKALKLLFITDDEKDRLGFFVVVLALPTVSELCWHN